ncbi:pyruvate kinase [Lacunimicrobium album]
MSSHPEAKTASVPKTKIVATIGPATSSREQLKALILAGVNVFRLNFAHGTHEQHGSVLQLIRELSAELSKPVAILGDLSGPKIRLGKLPNDEIDCLLGSRFEFVKGSTGGDVTKLNCTYEYLIDDLNPGDPVLLADGNVGMRVVEKYADEGRAVCIVEHPGLIRSKQGINLPGVNLRTPSLTEKDRDDLAWALAHRIDFVSLSFVRRAEDLRHLRQTIEDLQKIVSDKHIPQIVAKIEKLEAIQELDGILEESDVVMVARGDLGVEADIVKVPILQKLIIKKCGEARVPVITATQMLDSMQHSPFPTRAEATDVANAVLDGTDAVMLSGETAVGKFPVRTVEVMRRIVMEAETLLATRNFIDARIQPGRKALEVTEAMTLAAGTAASQLQADLIVVITKSGRTALSMSKQRHPMPVLAITKELETSRKLCMVWGVYPHFADIQENDPKAVLSTVLEWGKSNGILKHGSKIALILDSIWSAEGHDVLMIHTVD